MKTDKELEMEFLGSDPKKKAKKMNKVVTDSKKKSQFSKDVSHVWDETKVIAKNTEQFIEALSLLIVTGFAIYGSLTYELRNEYKYAVLLSGVVVGLIAMNLLRKFLARR